MSFMKNIPVEQLKELFEFSAIINSSLKVDEVRERAATVVMKLLDCEAASLLLFDEERGELYFDVALGDKASRIKTIRLNLGEGIAGWVGLHKQAIIVNDVQHDDRFFRVADEMSGFVTKSIACAPVVADDKLLGVIQAINKKVGTFDEHDLELLKAVSAQVAVAIDNARLHNEFKQLFYETILTLADTIEKRDPHIGGHVKRVTDYSIAVAIEMGLDRDTIEKIKLAAMLHDIGKVFIKDAILFKEGQLSEAEEKIMRKHTLYGEQILSRIKHLDKDVILGVKYHHELLDGSGYPEGLKGDEIPLVARIIAVPNAFDGMVINRSYRMAVPVEKAIKEIQEKSGIHYDPIVVESFLKVFYRMNTEEQEGDESGGMELGKYV